MSKMPHAVMEHFRFCDVQNGQLWDTLEHQGGMVSYEQENHT